jgi:N6-adenosine-specific RNA methylase IME4
MLQIKDEFKKLIPPLTVEEFKQLEDNCISEGIRDAIVTWNGYIIDGHNRYEIAQKYGLEFRVEAMEFEGEDEVKEWMILNQFGRRNLNNYQRSVLALELEDVFSKRAKESKAEKISHFRTTGEMVLKSEPSKKTIQHIGNIAKVGKDTIAKVKVIKAKAPEEVKAKLASGELHINQAYQEIKKEEKKAEIIKKKEEYVERVESITTNEFKVDIFNTNEKFRVIYADPAWRYNDKCEGGGVQSGGVEMRHYNTMTIKEICDLPVSKISEKDSVLFLWVTSPLLEDAFKVVNAWGFKYKTSFIWDKIKHNMGHYNSVRHEILLICTKGSCTPDNKTLYDSVQSIEKSNRHSEKPIEFLNIIDDLYTYGNKLEMFCRDIKKENWFGWGNEL